MDVRGRTEYTNGDIYQRDWEGHQRNGFGKLVRSDGLKYEGSWKDDVPSDI